MMQKNSKNMLIEEKLWREKRNGNDNSNSILKLCYEVGKLKEVVGK